MCLGDFNQLPAIGEDAQPLYMSEAWQQDLLAIFELKFIERQGAGDPVAALCHDVYECRELTADSPGIKWLVDCIQASRDPAKLIKDGADVAARKGGLVLYVAPMRRTVDAHNTRVLNHLPHQEVRELLSYGRAHVRVDANLVSLLAM